jgi:hypothetical protein
LILNQHGLAGIARNLRFPGKLLHTTLYGKPRIGEVMPPSSPKTISQHTFSLANSHNPLQTIFSDFDSKMPYPQ